MVAIGRMAAIAALGMPLLVPSADRARADVLVTIDRSSQRMSVAVDGIPRYLWRISTGRRGSRTGSGRFRPQWMARTYFSRKFYDAPMPHAIVFDRGFAIHGAAHLRRRGGPASSGCVRLEPRDAATLFALVQRHGMRNTRVVIGNAVSLKRPKPWREGQQDEAQAIARITEQLLLTADAERQEALTRMKQLRAAEALKRAVVGNTGESAAAAAHAVAIGVDAVDDAKVPAPVRLSMSPVMARWPVAEDATRSIIVPEYAIPLPVPRPRGSPMSAVAAR